MLTRLREFFTYSKLLDFAHAEHISSILSSSGLPVGIFAGRIVVDRCNLISDEFFLYRVHGGD